MKTDKIGFIGLGLIGGSIAKAIKKFYPSTNMIAIASSDETCKLAYDDAVISNDKNIPLDEFCDCDIIFLCSPVQVNVEYMSKLKNIISKDCIITDVGSVKGDISKAAKELNLTSRFIGGHPMTGAEKTGFANAKESLLENAYYILTAEDDLDRKKLDEFDTFIKSLGAITLKMKPSDHDYATAAISHLPHVVSATLVNLVKNSDDNAGTCKTIAAGGFKDITRISSSSPIMWQHICLTNKDEIIKLIDAYANELSNFREAIAASDEKQIIDLFSSAKDYRDSLTIPVANPAWSIFELYLYVEDKPGTILAALTLLFIANISIKNLDIIHNREFEPGVLRIEFYHEPELLKAYEIYQRNEYDVKLRKE
ncbi:MAG: prephenate dehydrogenase/arogenate dehydrogenase family protein [Pseudobutyrivibrio sp.]|nr:prephenate dehydrogenase/arogenate dehydrogenase family protein [Pseudobutyrivibrio sp.]